ncbi:hypothetical protein M1D97_12205 [Kushneria sp. AK178]
MLETIEFWLRDSLIQSLLLSPLMGLVFGTIFSGLTVGNREVGKTSVRETIIIIKERITIRDGGGRKGGASNDDPMVLLFFLLVVTVFSIYLYAVYAKSIIEYASIAALNVIAFGFSVLIVSAIKGRLNSGEWIAYTFIPIVFVSCSLLLLHRADLGILPGAKEAAESAGAYRFYFDVLDDEQRYWVIAQLFGLLGTIVFLFFSIVLVVHNIAALQVIYNGFMQPFWQSVFLFTNAFSGRFAWVFLSVLGVVTYFSLDGTVYQYFTTQYS